MVADKRVDLCALALGLSAPWQVVNREFDRAAGQLDLWLDFARGARLACPATGCAERDCPVHDTTAKTWRHLDFFGHKAFLHASVPRVRCPQHGVRLVALPWARPGSGFTLLFEALLITFAAAMPVARVAAMVREHDTRIWRVLAAHATRERARADFSGVTTVGMDETRGLTRAGLRERVHGPGGGKGAVRDRRTRLGDCRPLRHRPRRARR